MFESTQTDISAALSVPASMGSFPARVGIATATYRLLINSNIADDRRPVVACATLRAEENRATTIFFDVLLYGGSEHRETEKNE